MTTAPQCSRLWRPGFGDNACLPYARRLPKFSVTGTDEPPPLTANRSLRRGAAECTTGQLLDFYRRAEAEFICAELLSVAIAIVENRARMVVIELAVGMQNVGARDNRMSGAMRAGPRVVSAAAAIASADAARDAALPGEASASPGVTAVASAAVATAASTPSAVAATTATTATARRGGAAASTARCGMGGAGDNQCGKQYRSDPSHHRDLPVTKYISL
jgi:hypothetical protein